MKKICSITPLLFLMAMLVAGAAQAVESVDGLRLQKITGQVYAVVGPLGNRTPENLGNNATFGFVVTDEGVVVIDSGGSNKGAAAIDALIRQVTDLPVKVVINSGGQDHRWLGNGYFKARGARIIASEAAVADQRKRLQDQMFVLGTLVGEKGMAGTEAVYAEETFAEGTRFTLGGTAFEVQFAGPAHTPGDSFVWLPKQRVVFTGDIVFVERLLGVLEHSSSSGWLEAFDAVAALEPKTVVPGHGPATDFAQASKDTRDYLTFLRDAVGTFMEAGGSITDIGNVDQSAFMHMESYELLKGRNAQQVYQEMEWE